LSNGHARAVAARGPIEDARQTAQQKRAIASRPQPWRDAEML